MDAKRRCVGSRRLCCVWGGAGGGGDRAHEGRKTQVHFAVRVGSTCLLCCGGLGNTTHHGRKTQVRAVRGVDKSLLWWWWWWWWWWGKRTHHGRKTQGTAVHGVNTSLMCVLGGDGMFYVKGVGRATDRTRGVKRRCVQAQKSVEVGVVVVVVWPVLWVASMRG